MVANLDEVLQRGTALTDMQAQSSNLLGYSKKYREDTKKLNAKSKYDSFFLLMFIIF